MEIIPATPIASKYRLKMDDSSLSLKVIVGHGQMTAASYYAKPSIESPPSIEGTLLSEMPIALGADRNLHGQRLSILITVAATLSSETSVTIILSGGDGEVNITVATNAKQIGNVVAYEAYFRFTKS